MLSAVIVKGAGVDRQAAVDVADRVVRSSPEPDALDATMAYGEPATVAVAAAPCCSGSRW